MKNFAKIKAQVETLIQPILDQSGLVIYEINNTFDYESDVLQILVENGQQPQAPLDFDLLVKVNEAISEVLDQITELTDDYILEVASAGLEKPIRTAPELMEAQSHYVNVTFKKPHAKLLSVEGLLSAGPDEQYFTVSFFIKGRPKKVTFTWDEIDTARYAVKV